MAGSGRRSGAMPLPIFLIGKVDRYPPGPPSTVSHGTRLAESSPCMVGWNRVAKRTGDEALSVTVSLPRSAWLAELHPPSPRSRRAVSLLRGRLTCRQAVLLIRVAGSVDEIQEALQYWQCCGFRVEEGGIPDPLRDAGTLLEPSLPDRGSSSRGFRDPFSGFEEPNGDRRTSEDESTSGVSG
jgi:hypothetical protein